MGGSISYSQNSGIDYGVSAHAGYGIGKRDGKEFTYEKLSFLELNYYEEYDHGERNENQPRFETRAQIDAYAASNGLEVGIYSKGVSGYHRGPGADANNEKLWVGKGPLSIVTNIPAMEYVVRGDGRVVTNQYKGIYNYGNDGLSHIFRDIVPHKYFGTDPDY